MRYSLLILLVLLAGCHPAEVAPHPSEVAALHEQEAFQPGDILAVDAGSDPTGVPVDASAYADFAKYQTAKDESGYREMTTAGRLLIVKRGTKVKVIDADPLGTKYEVRIMDGEAKDRKGYVASNWLRRP